MMRTTNSGQHGLTLVELLVAITLSVVLAGFSFRLFNAIVKNQERLEVSQKTLSDLNLMVQFLEKDIVQFQPDSTNRNGYGQIETALFSGEGNLITLTRSGWPISPVQSTPRSELQRVRWNLVDQSDDRCRHTMVEGLNSENNYCLVRSYNRQLDSLYNDDLMSVDIAGYIEESKFKFLYTDDTGSQQWSNQWPPLNHQPEQNIEAIELSIVHQRFGELSWLFQTPVGWEP